LFNSLGLEFRRACLLLSFVEHVNYSGSLVKSSFLSKTNGARLVSMDFGRMKKYDDDFVAIIIILLL